MTRLADPVDVFNAVAHARLFEPIRHGPFVGAAGIHTAVVGSPVPGTPIAIRAAGATASKLHITLWMAAETRELGADDLGMTLTLGQAVSP